MRRSNVFERNPALRPITDLSKRVLELTAFFCQLVFDSDWRFRNDGPEDQVFSFQRAKPLREHAIGDIRYGSLDRRVARPAIEQDAQNGTRPPTTDELYSAVEA